MKKADLPNAILYRILAGRRRWAREPYKRVCIYKVDRLGDFILALGAIRVLVRHFGAANCVLAVSSHAVEIARREFPAVERVVLREPRYRLWETWLELVRQRSHPLFQLGVERLVCLRHHRWPEEEVALATIPARETIGFEGSPLGGALPPGAGRRWGFSIPSRSFEPAEGQCHEIAIHHRVLRDAVGEDVGLGECIPALGAVEGARVEGSIGVFPFGTSPLRDIPDPVLVRLGLATEQTGKWTLAVCGPTGDARHASLVERLRACGVTRVQLVTCASISELVAAIAKCGLVIATESGPAHIAAAQDAPMVALIGGGHHGWFAPWSRSERQRWIANRLECFGCKWVCRYPEPRCMTEISPERVLREVLQ